MKSIQALILTPLEQSHDPILATIKEALLQRSIQPIVIDQISSSTVLANAVTDAIQQADLIVADVSKKNANVLFELGFSLALRKPTLLLLSTDELIDVPPYLAAYQMITYDPKNLLPLRHQIERFLDYQQSKLM
jgi:nucleoside 2-deoxyribosyltransferase